MSEEGIVITPDKVFIRVWNGEKKKYQRRIIKPKNLPFYCWEPVSFEGDVSLGRLFSLIEANRRKWEILLCENLEPFLEEAQKPATKKEDDPEALAFLELYWGAETTIYKGKSDFSLWPSFHGVGYATEDDKYEMYKKGDRVTYAIEFTPVNELIHLPVKLDEKVKVLRTDLDTFEATKNIDNEETELGDKAFTLLELLKGIFWEITFLGSPEHRDEEMTSMREAVDDIKSGKVETIPWEEAMEKIEKKVEKKKKDLKDLLDEGM